MNLKQQDVLETKATLMMNRHHHLDEPQTIVGQTMCYGKCIEAASPSVTS